MLQSATVAQAKTLHACFPSGANATLPSLLYNTFAILHDAFNLCNVSDCPVTEQAGHTYEQISDADNIVSRPTYLEEPLQPPHLEEAHASQDNQLEDAPPLHTRICALRCVSVGPFAHDDVALLVLDLGNQLGQLSHC